MNLESIEHLVMDASVLVRMLSFLAMFVRQALQCTSLVELDHHKTVYHYEWDLPDEPNFMYEFPCDVCDTNCRSKVELEQHRTAYHYSCYTEGDLKSCDFCGHIFGTLGELRNQIRSLHK